MANKKNLDPVRKMLCDNLRKLRLEHDYSMQHIAEAMGKTDYTGYQRLENGKTEIKFEDAFSLAKLYKVPMERIWNGKDQPIENQVTDISRTYQLSPAKASASIFIQVQLDGTSEKLNEQIKLMKGINNLLKTQESATESATKNP